MAPSVFLLCILIVKGFLSVHCTDKSTEQTGLYFIKEPNDVIVVKGEALTLPCSAGSSKNKDLKLIWIHNGFLIASDERRQLLPDGSLYFTKIIHKKNGYSDQGEYSCVISDGNGYLSSRLILLRVSVMRNFTEHPRSQTVSKGSHVRMSCHFDSLPEPNIIWDHDDEILPQKSLHHLVLSGPGISGSIMYIFNVRPEDAGKYRCTATNPLTKSQRQSKRAVLTVRLKDDKQVPFKFLSVPQVKTVKEGDNVALDCVVDTSPYPTISWTYQRKGVSNAVNILNSTATGYNIAYLKNVTLQKSGLYSCSDVSNTSKEMVMEIRVMTRPAFLERPESVTYQAAKAVRFRCKAAGNPVPLMMWMKDGQPVNITGRITQSSKIDTALGMRTSDLLVASSLASDAGIYQCMASNQMGTIWSAARLILNATKPAPKPPEVVSCETMSSTAINVRWDVSEDTPRDVLKAFTIHYHDIDGGEELREAVPPDNRSIILRSLHPYTNYTFYLRSYSDTASDFSQHVVCQTGEEVPEVAPELQLISSTPHSLQISWVPLTKKQARGKIIEYKMQWRLRGAPSTNVQRVNGDVLNYTITDLVPDSEYEVRVLAATSKGWPNQTLPWNNFKLPEAYSFSVPPEPNIQLEAVNASTIKIIWSSLEDFGGELSGFKLFYRKENGTLIGPFLISANSSEYYIKNLEPETEYEVTLFGFTEKKDGKPGKASVQTLGKDQFLEVQSETHIDPPVSLEAVPSSRGTINLSWSPPSSGSINYYTVCYNPVQISLTVNKSSINCLKSPETEISVSDLESYTLYEFRVRSHVHEDQYSEFSQSVECYTVEDVPSQVVDIKWKAENKTTIFASWRQPRRTNGIIRNYTIFYTRDSTLPLPSWSTKVVPADTYKTHLTDLLPNTEYSMIIRASTSAGLGSYGNPKQVIIPVLMEVASKKTPKNEKERRNEQYVGIIVGLGIGLGCIIICTLCIVCRRRCVKNQPAEEVEPPSGCQVVGNACHTERDMRSNAQDSESFSYIATQNCSPDHTRIEEPFESKGRCPNGFSNGIRMTLLSEAKNSSSRSNINITENPRFDSNYRESPILFATPNLNSSDSDVMNNSKIPLLSGKWEVTANQSPTPEPTPRGKTADTSEEKSVDLPKKPNSEQDKNNRSSDAKDNQILENPDFRFSDSGTSNRISSSQFRKNGYYIPQTLCNGASDPLLPTRIQMDSSGLYNKIQSLMNPISAEMKQDC